MNKRIVIILAAGESSRMWPFNFGGRHKSHIILGGQSILERTITISRELGEKTVVVKSPAHKLDEILSKKVMRAESLEFVVQEKPLSQGEAVLRAFNDNLGYEKYFVLNAYHFSSKDLLVKLVHSVGHQESCLALFPTTEIEKYGIAEASNGRVTRIVEKPHQGEVNSNLRILGTYLLDNYFLKNYLRGNKITEDMLERALDRHAQKNSSLKYIESEKDLSSLKYPWELLGMMRGLFLDGFSGYIHPLAKVDKTAVIDERNGPVRIEEGAQILEYAVIKGPAYIGRNVLIGNYSLIRESSVEEGCLIGSHSEIARSLLQPRVTVHRAYLGDCVLGTDVKVGAGFISANRRFDRKNISVMVRGKKVDTGRKSLGVMIGDNVSIGVHSSSMPGTMIGANVQIYPHQSVRGIVQDNQVVK